MSNYPNPSNYSSTPSYGATDYTSSAIGGLPESQKDEAASSVVHLETYDTMMVPEVEGLLDKAGSKFGLCTLASTRAREINAYFHQLGDGLGAKVPPQVTSVARKPLSIAFEEIAVDKIVPVRPKPEVEAAPSAPEAS